MNAVYRRYVSAGGHAPSSWRAYHGYRHSSPSAQATHIASTAGEPWSAGTGATIAQSTFARAHHCVTAFSGEPFTSPSAACATSSPARSWST